MLVFNTNRALVNTKSLKKISSKSVDIYSSYRVYKNGIQRTKYRVPHLNIDPHFFRLIRVQGPLKRVEKWFLEKKFFGTKTIPSVLRKVIFMLVKFDFFSAQKFFNFVSIFHCVSKLNFLFQSFAMGQQIKNSFVQVFL